LFFAKVEEQLDLELTEEERRLAETMAAMAATSGKSRKENRDNPVAIKQVEIPTEAVAGERIEIQIELNRNAPIQVRIGELICPRPSRGHIGSYRVDFTPQDPGKLAVMIIVGVEPPIIHKGIIQVRTGCAELCVVHDLPRKMVTCDRVNFKVEARDICGNPCPAKDCSIQVWRGEPPVPVKCGIIEGGGSTPGSTPIHPAWFEATAVGPHTVEVWGRQAPTALTPFIVNVRSPDVNPEMCKVHVTDKSILARCMVGIQQSLTVEICGGDGIRREADVSTATSSGIELDTKVIAEGDGIYRIEYIAVQPGQGQFFLKANGKNVAGSPFPCNVGMVVKAGAERITGQKVFLTL